MARLSRLLSAVSLGIAATAAVAAVAVATEYNPVRRAPTHRAEAADDARVIVKFKSGATDARVAIASTASEAAAGGPQRAASLGGRVGILLTDGRILGERTQVLQASGMTSSALAKALAADSEVEWAEVDHKRYVQAFSAPPVNDPLYPDGLSTTVAPNGPGTGQWYLRAPYTETVMVKNETTGVYVPTVENVVSGINVEPAWAITQGSSSIVVADVDTGITSHPDLDSKMLTGYDFVADAQVANDGGGRDADPSDPGDWVSAIENSTKNGKFYGCNDDGTGAAVAENSSWHGTQTASILGAATNNGVGMAGVGYNTPVFAARALGKCGGYDSDIIAAAQWSGGIAVSGVPANAHPARVINMSLGGQDTCSQAYVDALTALRNKNVIVVVAAGNDEGLPVGTPANCKPATTDADQTPIVIAVAALRHAGTKVGFSDIGPEVTLSAPGGNCLNTGSGEPCIYPIITALNAGTTNPVAGGGTYSDGTSHVSLGTSFATPMVAGTVALMLSADPGMSNREIIRQLQKTSRAFPTVSDTSPQPPVCTAPNANVKQDECICTTSTCGAGMLDAGAAVTAAQSLVGATAPTAVIASSATSIQVGTTLAVSGSGSTNGSTSGSLTYEWRVVDGASNVTLANASSASANVTAVAAGSATLQLRVTDDNGLSSTATTTITVTPIPTPSGHASGAANPLWLLALAIAGLMLRPRARSPARSRA